MAQLFTSVKLTVLFLARVVFILSVLVMTVLLVGGTQLSTSVLVFGNTFMDNGPMVPRLM